MSESKNPREIAYVVRGTTFAIFDGLTEADIERGEEPLTLHASTFSRFKFLIISADKKAGTANITARDIFGVLQKSKIAAYKDVDFSLSMDEISVDNDRSAPAYTVKLTSGNLKGRTPAEILLTNGQQGEAALTNQYKFLEENLNRYKGNKEQMDAILDAFNRLDNGTLNAGSVRKKQEVMIYNSGCRPLVRKKDARGNSFVYELEIKWILGERYPVVVSIRNYYAPVIKTKDGLYNVKISQRDKNTEIVNIMNLSADEWAYACHMIETDIENFERILYTKKRKEAQKYEAESRRKAGIPERSRRNQEASYHDDKATYRNASEIEGQKRYPNQAGANGYGYNPEYYQKY